MSLLKMNLRSGVASLAHFTGIGKGLAQPAARARTEPFVAIGGAISARTKDKRAEQPAPDDDNDAEALDDDDYGADAPNDDDAPEEAEDKRARRVARRARRMNKQPPKDDGQAPAPSNGTNDMPDDDDSDTEMRGSSPVAKARRAERARCATIFAHPAAAQNPDLAAHLAFNTTMSRKEAVGVLARGGSPKGGLLASLMAPHAGQRPGSPPAPEAPKAQQTQKSVDAVFTEVTAYRRAKK